LSVRWRNDGSEAILDVLSEVLRVVRLSGAIHFRGEFTQPWAIPPAVREADSGFAAGKYCARRRGDGYGKLASKRDASRFVSIADVMRQGGVDRQRRRCGADPEHQNRNQPKTVCTDVSGLSAMPLTKMDIRAFCSS
jgi:hypothetical protein